MSSHVCYIVIQFGATALHMAAHEGKPDVVKLLIEAKAQINMQIYVCDNTISH